MLNLFDGKFNYEYWTLILISWNNFIRCEETSSHNPIIIAKVISNMHRLAMHTQSIKKYCWILEHSWNINILLRFQSQIFHAEEILKQLQPGDEDQSGENIPAAVKGA